MAPSLQQQLNLSRRACRRRTIYDCSRPENKLQQNRCFTSKTFHSLNKKCIFKNNIGANYAKCKVNLTRCGEYETHVNLKFNSSSYKIINNKSSNLKETKCKSSNSQLNNKQNKLYFNTVNVRREEYSGNENLMGDIKTVKMKEKKQVNRSIFCGNSAVLVLLGAFLLATTGCGFVEAKPFINGTASATENVVLGTNNGLDVNPTVVGCFSGVPEVNAKLAVDANEKSHESKEAERFAVSSIDFSRVEAPIIISIWILSASAAKIGFHMTPKLSNIFPESCLLIVIGVCVGVVLFFVTTVHVSPLTPNTFFFYMLPPIILDAGYFMPNRLFFDNLGTILLMAVIGTIFNVVLIGGGLWTLNMINVFNMNIPILHLFLFASLISAVDPVAVLAVFEEIHVNEVLYIVVFGESLLNDAVTVVLYHMFESYNHIGIKNIQVIDCVNGALSFFVVAFGGTIIGVIWGFMTGLVTRFTDNVRVIEPLFIFIMAYLSYLNAELFHLSGIMAITFCGITMKNYVEANVSNKSHTTIKYALKMLSSSSETIIFIFLGVATVNNLHVWDTWFVIFTILLCTIVRCFGVILLAWMANKFRLHKLSNVDKFVISYGGLRGAVAFALALLISDEVIPAKRMFVTTTIAVIFFTVFVQGITIRPLVKFLKVKKASKRKPTMNERIHEKVVDHLMAGVEDIIGKTGNYNVRDKFKRFDNRFIRPLLIRDLQATEPKILETYSKLTMKDAIDIMRRNPSTAAQLSNTESMSALFRNYTFGGSPSFSNLEGGSRNLDMHELDYNPSKKDLTDAKIHHLLAEELKPYRRASLIMHRRLSYSRHSVYDHDLMPEVNYRIQMNSRRMTSMPEDGRRHHRKSKRLASKVNKPKDGTKTNHHHVSFNDFQQNGSAKQLSNDYINEVLQEGNDDVDTKIPKNQSDEWEGGLTFTAKPTPLTSPSEIEYYNTADRANNNSLLAHIASLPGFDTTKARLVKQYIGKSNSEREIVPTAAELILPWRRDRSYHSIGTSDGSSENIPAEQMKRLSKDSESEENATTPTATESVLPWKRGDDDGNEGGALKQNEFPAWVSNKEYLAYNSPSATFLGGLTKPKAAKSVIGLFRRESSGSGSVPGVIGGIATDSDTSIQLIGLSSGFEGKPITVVSGHRPSSISLGGASFENSEPLSAFNRQIAAPFPITASHRRNNRQGSLLELSGDTIPEENNYTKSLPDREKHSSRRIIGSGGEQPLLKNSIIPKQIAPHRSNPQSAALLAMSSGTETESDEDYDDNINLST